MTKVEITIKADALIAAISKLAAAVEEIQAYQIPHTAEFSAESKPDETLPAPVVEAEPPVQAPVTIEQIRAILAEKSQAGKQPQVKELITKFGAKKLTDINPVHYAELLKEAEVL